MLSADLTSDKFLSIVLEVFTDSFSSPIDLLSMLAFALVSFAFVAFALVSFAFVAFALVFFL